ncbi:hypothetical protein ABZV65_14005 [Streptomyces bauhiniae]|uniref:hypothetical protein n=1 Tax=Streptomyces bauhiniae TaxID=2340725 RepID=UPI0033A67813
MRRRAYLLAAGIGWLLYGVQVVQDPRPQTVRSAAVLANVAPISAWGWAWVAGSAVAIIAAASGRDAWMWVGFACAMYPPLLWGVAYLGAWLTGSYPGAWAGAATWCGTAVRLLLVAGWREEQPVAVPSGPEVIRE